jgi:hypothetical protein
MVIPRNTTDTRKLPIPQAAVRAVTLFLEQAVATDGTTTYFDFPLDLPEIADWGPNVAGITAVTTSHSNTANFEWKVTTRWSFDGVEWSSSTDLFAGLSAGPGPAIQNEFTDRTKMGPRMQFALAVRNSAGGAPESAVVSCIGYFRFLT